LLEAAGKAERLWDNATSSRALQKPRQSQGRPGAGRAGRLQRPRAARAAQKSPEQTM